MSSYTKINYSLRPAKHIERKMLSDAFRKLAPFARVETYRYIGFGSIYYSDFILLHKSLGVGIMISIEHDVDKRDRFLFNRPFGCIQLEFGESAEILPTLTWDVRTIAWLDYDGQLTSNVLTDVACFFANANPGSVFVVSVNAQLDQNEQGDPIATLKAKIGENKVPPEITAKDLAGWGAANIYRRIIDNEIQETLARRNGSRAKGTRYLYRQIFNFNYADGAKMLTTGGVLYDEGQQSILEQCAFQDLEFYRPNAEPYKIDVPALTYKEIRHLDAQLPLIDGGELNAPAIPHSDVIKYSRVYRYFPTFAEADL